MPNLDSPLAPLCRAPDLLEVHLPQFGEYCYHRQCALQSNGEKKKNLKEPNFRFLHTSSKQPKLKNGDDSHRVLLKGELFFQIVFSQNLSFML